MCLEYLIRTHPPVYHPQPSFSNEEETNSSKDVYTYYDKRNEFSSNLNSCKKSKTVKK